MSPPKMMNKQAKYHFIDITADVCPMTFVKSKLAYERAQPGEILEISMRGKDPMANVPRALAEIGAEILSLNTLQTGVTVLCVKKASVAK